MSPEQLVEALTRRAVPAVSYSSSRGGHTFHTYSAHLFRAQTVKHEEGENLAKEFGYEFFEVSAKVSLSATPVLVVAVLPPTQSIQSPKIIWQEKINVDQAFTRMVKLITDKLIKEDNKESHNIDLNNNVQKKKSGGCC